VQLWPRGDLWDNRGFLNLWAAQSVSAIGSRITRTVLPVIAVIGIGGSPFELALLSAISVGPAALVGLLAAGRVDRSSKRRILILTDLTRAILVLALPIWAWMGELTMAHVYVVGGLMGVATTLFQITDNAYLPVLVPKRHLVLANSRLETTESIAEVSGPGLAGVLIELVTAPVALVIDAATYLWSAAFLTRIDHAEAPDAGTPQDTLMSDLRAGIGAVWAEPHVRPLLLATAIMTTSGGFFLALYMLFTLGDLALSPGAVGLIISVGGIGALFGALLSRRAAAALGVGRAMLVCSFFGQATALLIPLAGGPVALAIALLVAHQLLSDGLIIAYEIQATSLRQSVLPINLLARCNAVFAVTTAVLLPLGALAAGVLAEAFGVRVAIWVGVSLGLLAPLALLPLRHLKQVPQSGRVRLTDT
jgi:predicted MFS family arabinose efflux permease